jgi:predicted RNA-binding protein YlqC (UPF0109 family)
MKDLVEYVAKTLVDDPEAVSVSEIDGERTSVIELRVADEDRGKIIGRGGKTAEALRIILGAAGAKMKKRYVLEILEE